MKNSSETPQVRNNTHFHANIAKSITLNHVINKSQSYLVNTLNIRKPVASKKPHTILILQAPKMLPVMRCHHKNLIGSVV